MKTLSKPTKTALVRAIRGAGYRVDSEEKNQGAFKVWFDEKPRSPARVTRGGSARAVLAMKRLAIALRAEGLPCRAYDERIPGLAPQVGIRGEGFRVEVQDREGLAIFLAVYRRGEAGSLEQQGLDTTDLF